MKIGVRGHVSILKFKIPSNVFFIRARGFWGMGTDRIFRNGLLYNVLTGNNHHTKHRKQYKRWLQNKFGIAVTDDQMNNPFLPIIFCSESQDCEKI